MVQGGIFPLMGKKEMKKEKKGTKISVLWVKVKNYAERSVP